MARFQERRSSRAAQWSRRLASFSLILLLMAAVSHRIGLLETLAFFGVLGIVATLAILAIGLSTTGYYRLWQFGERAGRDATRGLIIGLLVATPFLYSAYNIFAYPRLHDISTDLLNPPMMPLSAAARASHMNPIGRLVPADAALQADQYPQVTGRRYAAPPDRVLASIISVINGQGWEIRGKPTLPPAGGRVEVEAAAGSFILNLPADISVRLADDETSSYVDVRSSSRYGLHDFGDNASRIVSFLIDLDAAVAVQVAPPVEVAPPPAEPPADGEPPADTPEEPVAEADPAAPPTDAPAPVEPLPADAMPAEPVPGNTLEPIDDLEIYEADPEEPQPAQ